MTIMCDIERKQDYERNSRIEFEMSVEWKREKEKEGTILIERRKRGTERSPDSKETISTMKEDNEGEKRTEGKGGIIMRGKTE